MTGASIAKEIVEPYAQALMAIAQSQDLVDRFNEDASSLIELSNASDELKQLLSNPFVKAGKKKSILRQIFGEQLHPVMTNFVMLLVDRGRIAFLEGVCKQYQALVRQQRQIVLAEVASAVPLSGEQQEAVRQKVVELTNAHQVELATSVNPDLLGGVVITVGSQVYDASLRGQLRRLGLSLSTTA
ncbi:ATP synthase F1 subunit delta [Leptolyngbya sp. AN02str]|uniref:ATP synthase F1 subunit delta n=1 Tax=Leptolyngbya sp. AN02str TaxID=3423363 RepID=UPI003D31B984